MPLINFCGLPLSGKSTHVPALQHYLQDLNYQVIIITDASLGYHPEIYSDPNEEKKCRAATLSAVERHLSSNAFVICDGLSYIKGFRYQLYCIARALNTPCCTVYTAIDPSLLESRNNGKYDPRTLQDLVSRFEEPNDLRNRWDSPLFTLVPGDDIIKLYGTRIVDALIHRKPLPQTEATQKKPLAEHNYLHELDQITQSLIEFILDLQRNGFPGGNVKWERSTLLIQIPSRKISLSELRRLKRQFLHLNNTKPLTDLQQLANSWVEYLNLNT